MAARLLATLLLLFFLKLARSGHVSVGGTCSAANNHLDPAYKFQSDCDDKTFCTGISGTCQPRQCRRDEFPFGYDRGDAIPPLCAKDSYCPDEGSGCEPLVLAGLACEMNRDDQCAPPPNWQILASNQNFNGSLCLSSVCTCANREPRMNVALTDPLILDLPMLLWASTASLTK